MIQTDVIYSNAQNQQPLGVTFQVPPADLISQFGLKLQRGKYDENGLFLDSQKNYNLGERVTVKLVTDQDFQFR